MNANNDKTRMVSFVLSADLYEELRHHAFHNRTTMTAVVREALTEKLIEGRRQEESARIRANSEISENRS